MTARTPLKSARGKLNSKCLPLGYVEERVPEYGKGLTKEETLRIIIFIERSISHLLRRFRLSAKIFRQDVESLSGRYLVSRDP